MQLPGQNPALLQERVSENLLAARNSTCCPSLLGSSHSSASGPSLKSIYPIPVSYTLSIFRITGSTEFCLQMNPAELTDWEKYKTTNPTDLKCIEIPFIGNTEQVAARISRAWCGLSWTKWPGTQKWEIRHPKEDGEAKKPGIQTKVTDLTWRCL